MTTAGSPGNDAEGPARLRELADRAGRYWVEHSLLAEEDLPSFLQPLHRLTEEAARRGLRAPHALAEHLTDVLLALSGATSLNAEHDEDVAHRLHAYRNLAGALLATHALLHGRSPRDALQPKRVPRLGRRTWLSRGRPLEDDERLLLRLLVHHLTQTGKHRDLLAAARYVLAEAGATPGETTAVMLDDLSDPAKPEWFWAPGYRDRDRRRLPLDDWQQPILARHAEQRITAGLAPRPLTYNGKKAPGSEDASASADGSLTRLLRHAGLGQLPDLTASSITFQAADRVCLRHGDDAGFALLGRASLRQALRDLRRVGWEPNPEPAAIRSFLDSAFPTYQGTPPGTAAADGGPPGRAHEATRTTGP
ncbi:hypothetical protein SAMN04488107_0044 [Geodermatophilus saharensis]|uniref:Uncharacterized protein n=1 Tax=Geodermatophilus saharensis TaxID=1137994 RepID=A0A238ZHE9_9ACTN|nr:hypothetical protein [Geodermatophilus saharensis]SNR82094.1 hypothetical protein SAMN04488107_0044 [Geodermatophilus saharensis]